MRDRSIQRLLFFLFISLPGISWAQSFTNHWYFGTTNQSIRFGRGSNTATLTTTKGMLGQGGSAVVADPANGDLLFYTSGAAIYDATHTPMPGGPLNGDINANQPVVVGRVPGQNDQYFVIVRETTGAIFYSIVDMTLQGNPGVAPLGDVAGPPTAMPLANRSQAMITVPHANGTDFWLITHTNFGGLAEYTAIQFGPTGPVSPAQVSQTGQILNAGNFEYNAATNQIVVSPNEAQRDVEILTFDPATGTLQLTRTLANSSVAVAAGNGIYDAEWSNNNKYIYISKIGTDGNPQIVQYNVDPTNPNSASVAPEPLTLAPDIRFSYGLQMAPDSTIYHLYETTTGEIRAGQILNTDTVASLVTYENEAFPGANFEGKQFSSFLPQTDINMTVDFTFAGQCMNTPTFFTPVVNPPADSLVWNVNGEDVFGEWALSRTFEEAGNITVTVTAYLNGQATTSAPKVVAIQDPEVQINLVRDTTACSSELPFPKLAGATGCTSGCFTLDAEVTGDATLQWFGPSGNLNNSSPTLSPDSAGFYYLVATSTVNQCQVYAPVNIREYRVQDRRSNIWYFGTNAGIDFNPLFDDPPGAAVNFPNPVMDAPEGTATISDRNGQVIFFTDGNQVWDRQFTPLAPVGLGGDVNSAQSSMIIPVPGDETLYYIFTTNEVPGAGTYELRYTLFDLRLNGGQGGLVDGDQNPATPPSTVLFTRSGERLTGNENWLISHEFGNNSFRAYPVTPTGIGAPVITGIGSDHSEQTVESGRGSMLLSTSGRLAVGLSSGGTSVIEVFDFVDSTGVVTNFRSVTLPAAGEVYGIGMTGDGSRMYATVLGSNSIYEFEYDDDTDTYVSLGPIANGPSVQPGAIQLSPGGQLFVALDGQTRLGVIQPSGTEGVPSTYNDNGFALGTTPDFPGLNPVSQLGLPNFIQTLAEPQLDPTLTAEGFCLRQPTSFAVSGYDSNIDQFAWDFQNDGTDDIPLGEAGENTAVEFTYPSAGPFTVKVTRFNRCQAMMPPDPFYPSQTLAIVINPGPDPAESMLNDPNNNLLCPDQVLTGSFALGNNATYEWSTGETTPTKLITDPGVYSVIVTETATGCSVTKLQGMEEYFNGFELGENLVFCEGATHTITSGLQDPSLTYVWTRRPVNPAGPDVVLTNGAAPFQQPLDVSAPGTFTYLLSVSEPGVCTTNDEVTFTINESPDFTLNVNPAACGGQGSIDLTVNAPTSLFRYSVLGPSIVPSISDLPPGVLQNIGPLDGGVYNVTVLDQLSQCAITQQRSIFDNTVTVAIDGISSCSPFTINASTNVIGTYSFDVLDPSLQIIASGTSSTPTFQVSSPLFAVNSSYSVVVTNALQCKGSAPTGPLVQGPAYTLGLTYNCAANSVQAVVLSGEPPAPTNFTFTAPAGVIQSQDAANGTAVFNTTTPGTHVVKVRAEGPGPTCPGEFEMPITISPFTAAINQDPANGCADVVTVSAVATPATGNYRFNWTRGGVAFSAPQQFPATIADHNVLYNVTITNNANGCFANASRTVSVLGNLSVSLGAPGLACEGNDLTLTAVPVGTADNFVWRFDGSPIAGANTASIVTPARRGVYSVTASRGPCQASDDITITPFVPTPIDLGPLKRICNLPGAPPNQGTATLRANPATFATYTWINPDQTEVVTTSAEYTATMVGTHTVNAINPNGCLSIDQVEVVLDCDPVIAGPNAFRPTSTVVGGPNNDNVNQNFFLYTFFIDPSSFEILVFNRWGEMVFRSTDPAFKWNGGYNNNVNNPLPAGSYSYLVRFKSENSPGKGVQEERGGVLLLR